MIDSNGQLGSVASVSSFIPATSITGAQLAVGTVTAANLAAGVMLSGPMGPQGPAGPAGATGAVGAQGIPGVPGLSGTTSWTDAAGQVTTLVKVGVGTATPAADLQSNGQNGVLFTGTYNTAGITPLPTSGAGARMMWLPEKAAFRAGGVNGAQWDAASIGQYSSALGASTIASGFSATALSYMTTASGSYSTAMGYTTIASGNTSTAMGLGTKASGDYSTALGSVTTASGFYATAMGRATTASGQSSTAMGGTTTASGVYATAMGAYTVASGNVSTAMGFTTTAPSAAEFVLGQFNTLYTPVNAITWNGSDRLFVIGNGTSAATPADALVVLKNGYVGIGTAAPTATLSVNGTANNTTGVWAVFSDERLKNIDGNYAVGLDALMQLQPITYHYKQGNALKLPHQPAHIGFSAQALQKVIPEAVSMTSAGYLEVDSGPVYWTMLNAIKDLKKQKDAEIAALKQELAALVSKVDMLVKQQAMKP